MKYKLIEPIDNYINDTKEIKINDKLKIDSWHFISEQNNNMIINEPDYKTFLDNNLDIDYQNYIIFDTNLDYYNKNKDNFLKNNYITYIMDLDNCNYTKTLYLFFEYISANKQLLLSKILTKNVTNLKKPAEILIPIILKKVKSYNDFLNIINNYEDFRKKLFIDEMLIIKDIEKEFECDIKDVFDEINKQNFPRDERTLNVISSEDILPYTSNFFKTNKIILFVISTKPENQIILDLIFSILMQEYNNKYYKDENIYQQYFNPNKVFTYNFSKINNFFIFLFKKLKPTKKDINVIMANNIRHPINFNFLFSNLSFMKDITFLNIFYDEYKISESNFMIFTEDLEELKIIYPENYQNIINSCDINLFK